MIESAQTASSAGISFNISSSGLKHSIQIDNWPFNAPTNTLDYQFSLNFTPPVTSYTNESIAPGLVRYTFFSSSKLVSTLQLLTKAVVDGVDTTISFTVTVLGGDVNVVIHFPHFSNSLFYDPDFSVTLAGSSGSGSGDGGSGGDLLPLLALLALLIPIAMIVVVVVVVVAVCIVRRARRSSSHGKGAVAFGDDGM